MFPEARPTRAATRLTHSPTKTNRGQALVSLPPAGCIGLEGEAWCYRRSLMADRKDQVSS